MINNKICVSLSGEYSVKYSSKAAVDVVADSSKALRLRNHNLITVSLESASVKPPGKLFTPFLIPNDEDMLRDLYYFKDELLGTYDYHGPV